ncbi:2-hydroxychromene-2-carboxylate isomerase [Ruegeria halocynthiae]|uniref:2-hydroxychromene-2-carboxylate isomerase n=1 Tax=Ruegeria halocynthiae TaxID=985054 RepID=A0A1H2Z5L7_9RHOB|nr:2-hydroxychromene-2-carboxylate isomerase [Ruegeria halocynthiae]SDX12627.1 2-hydroxychromene-2-carboxylate isomerase [Ruegeria halocynthiae]
MPATLQFWFDFASTYSYLSAMRIQQAATMKGVAVEWQPFLLGPIFAEQGWTTSPFKIYPAKGQYMWRDMERLCAARNLPFQRPESFPQNSLKAARLALAVEQGDRRAAFVQAVYSTQFASGHDISDPAVLSDCLAASGSAPDAVQRMSDPKIKADLFEQVARAKALHIFGAPSFIIGNELFWGDDRLDDAVSYASSYFT